MAINLNQVEQKSFLRLYRYAFLNPIAAAVNSVVASVDPSSAVTVGTALTQATAFATTATFRHARRITLVLTDNSFAAPGLTVSVRVKGHRLGKPVEEVISVTTVDTNATTSTSAFAYDAISSIVPTVVTGAAASDALTMGITADLGLPHHIDNVTDVISATKIVSGNTETIIAISSTTVDIVNLRSMLVHGTTITKGNDVFEVQYLSSNRKDDPGLGNSGAFA